MSNNKNSAKGAKDEAQYKRNHNNRRRGKGKTSASRPTSESNCSSDNNRTSYGRGTNDVNWYVPDQQILKDACRIPFSWPTGYPYRNSGSLIIDDIDEAVAGILSQGVMPTIGNAKTADDAVNTAMFGLYGFVRHMNSGSKNYDPTDLMLYILAVDSMYYWISWGTRIFSTLCMYSQGNRYLPQDLCNAQSIDFNDFQQNMAQFRYELNSRIPKVASFLIPSCMPILQRHSWLFSNYYIEGDTMKDQIYFYYPEGYYVFGLDNDGAGKLNAKFKGSTLTMADYLQCLDEMIDAVIENEDFNTMSGDIFKAYGSNVLTLALIPDMTIANLVKDEEVLLQFKNCKPTDVHRQGNNRGDQWYDNFFDIEQSANKDYLTVLTPESALLGYRRLDASHSNHFVGPSGGTAQENACLLASANQWTKDSMIVSPHADVTPEEIMVSTRGTMAFYIVPSTLTPYGFSTREMFFGSEWYCGYNIYRRRRMSNGSINTQRYAFERVLVADETDANILNYVSTAVRHTIPALSQFKYHPELVVYTVDASGVASKNVEAIFDVDNYAFIDYDALGRMHNTAIMGEFNVPKIAWAPTR